MRSNNTLDDTASQQSYSSKIGKASVAPSKVGFKDTSDREPSFCGIIRPKFVKREEADIYCCKLTRLRYSKLQ